MFISGVLTVSAKLATPQVPEVIQRLCSEIKFFICAKKKVLMLEGGAHSYAAFTTDGKYLVWGWVDHGQLSIAFFPKRSQDPSVIRRNERDKRCICLRPTVILIVNQAACLHAARITTKY